MQAVPPTHKREVTEVPRTAPLFQSGVDLLCPDPVWVFVNRQFYCGLPQAPTRVDDALIRAGNPHATVVYLRADAPIVKYDEYGRHA